MTCKSWDFHLATYNLIRRTQGVANRVSKLQSKKKALWSKGLESSDVCTRSGVSELWYIPWLLQWYINMYVFLQSLRMSRSTLPVSIHSPKCTYRPTKFMELGHMMPQYAPWAAYKTLSYLLGRENLTDHSNDGALYPSEYEQFGPGPGRRLPRSGGRRIEFWDVGYPLGGLGSSPRRM